MEPQVDYLSRYLAGEHEQVWSELVALGAAVRDEPHRSAALAVAAETMRRVRRNCESIVARLAELGYAFGLYPDGSDGYYSEGPLVPPDDDRLRAVEALKVRAGPIPVSLAAFWREVGSIDLVGMHPGWPELLDPLVVDPPGAVLAAFEEWEEYADEDEREEGFVAELAPDALHKDDISGGAPYGAALLDPAADFLFLNEPHGLTFVAYLRLAILRWGGFPGLEGRGTEFGPIQRLTEGLEPF
jgi:hypothetical protein